MVIVFGWRMDQECACHSFFCFFFNDTATTEIYTLSLHDALPITTALSPAKTRSIMMTWTSAAIAPCENISRSIIRSAPGWRQPHIFDDCLNLAEDRGSTADKGECAGEIPGGRRNLCAPARMHAGRQHQASRRRESANTEGLQDHRPRQQNDQRDQ